METASYAAADSAVSRRWAGSTWEIALSHRIQMRSSSFRCCSRPVNKSSVIHFSSIAHPIRFQKTGTVTGIHLELRASMGGGDYLLSGVEEYANKKMNSIANATTLFPIAFIVVCGRN
ncbi:hypothetical protein EVAR_36771_1 [Eumeta japonica]|uniref:Uncharacterized protein n=1 Tax=Eumeta variegata TaxID=151549 RepID=A0A4C1X1R4_EUMVA|nr:hypothetical protein EVAR_36771_1 [Eumeta japonica]